MREIPRPPEPSPFRHRLARTVVEGPLGAGKTTFARRLATSLAAPHVEIDALYWQADRDVDRLMELTADAVGQGRWVADTNRSAVRDLLWSRATTVIWLNYPFSVTYRRALERRLRRLVYREAPSSTGRRSIRLILARELRLWLLPLRYRRYRRLRRDYRTLFAGDSHPHFSLLEFRSPRQAEWFLQSLAPLAAPGAGSSRLETLA